MVCTYKKSYREGPTTKAHVRIATNKNLNLNNLIFKNFSNAILVKDSSRKPIILIKHHYCLNTPIWAHTYPLLQKFSVLLAMHNYKTVMSSTVKWVSYT